MSGWKLLRIFAIFGLAVAFDGDDVVNQDVYAKTDLEDQLVHVKNVIIFHNAGTDALRSYVYAIDEPELHYVTFYNRLIEDLKYKKVEKDSKWIHFEVFLDEVVMPNQTYKMFATVAYANKIVPVYKQRKFEEDQLVKFVGNLHFFSPYKTVLFKSEYIVKNDSLVTTTSIPRQLSGTKIVYEFRNIEKYSKSPVVLILVNNDPFLVINNLQRIIDVNHFGKIFLQDRVLVENNGAKLVGPYSHDHSHRKKASTDWFFTHLPASAEDIKFFDDLGNSSLTKIYHFVDYITLKFRTRYPLLGGWKTFYYLQYAVPTHEYLYTSDNFYMLEILAVDHILDGKVVENSVIKIVLPEGAQVRNVHLPEGLTLSQDEVSYSRSALCIFGRPTIVLNGSNLFENHVASVKVEYFFDSLYLLKAPLLISCYVQAAFLFVLVGKYFFL